MKAIKKIRVPSGFRQFSVSQNQHIFLLVAYDTVRIYNTTTQSPVLSIKFDTTPRSAKLSPCGKYFYVHDSNNVIKLYDSKQGIVIQQILDVSFSIKTIKFSKNSLKLMYASTQMMYIWNIPKCAVDVRTQHWKNINCYDINSDGNQFAIGTYNGDIFVLDFIEVGKFNQIKIKRHKTCVTSICCHQNQIISASHDGYFLVSTITSNSNQQRIISYHEMKLKSPPKEIQSIGDNFYMFNNEGMTWFVNKSRAKNQFKLTGFTDFRQYRPFQTDDGRIFYVINNSGQLEWWPASAYKTVSELQEQKAQKQRKQKQKQSQKANSYVTYRTTDGKQNTYRIVYRR